MAGRHSHHPHGTLLPPLSPPTQHGYQPIEHVVVHYSVRPRHGRGRLAPLGRIGKQQGSTRQRPGDPSARPASDPLRPQLARLEDDVDSSQVRAHCCDGVQIDISTLGGQQAGAHRAPPARPGVWIVERPLQKFHQAALAPGVRAHQVGLGRPGRPDASPFLLVVHVRHPGGPPAFGHPFHGSLDGHDLDQRFHPPSADAGGRFEVDHAHGPAPIRQYTQHLIDVVRIRYGGGSEELPQAFVTLCREQDGIGSVDGPTGPADLLVVSHR